MLTLREVSNTRYFFFNTLILALRTVLVSTLVLSGILSAIVLILALYTFF